MLYTRRLLLSTALRVSRLYWSSGWWRWWWQFCVRGAYCTSSLVTWSLQLGWLMLHLM